MLTITAVPREGWWSQTGSNRRPPACKAGALPAELWPHCDLGRARVVGLGGLEPPASPLSGVRSDQLSYRPVFGAKALAVIVWSARINLCGGLWIALSVSRKGGDPAAGSPTATLLRLHPSHRPHRGKRPPFG